MKHVDHSFYTTKILKDTQSKKLTSSTIHNLTTQIYVFFVSFVVIDWLNVRYSDHARGQIHKFRFRVFTSEHLQESIGR